MTGERIIDQRGSDQEHAEWMQRGWAHGYAKGFGDVAAIAARREAALREATDGLPSLLSQVLRRYGGTMKGRGDHDIFDALVRYRALLSEVPQ